MELASHPSCLHHGGALAVAPRIPTCRPTPSAQHGFCTLRSQAQAADRLAAISAVRRGGGRRRRDDALLDNWEDTAAAGVEAGNEQNGASNFQAAHQQNNLQQSAEHASSQMRLDHGAKQHNGDTYDPFAAAASAEHITDEQQNGASAYAYGVTGTANAGNGNAANASPLDDWGDWGTSNSSSSYGSSSSSVRGSSQSSAANGWRMPFQRRSATNGSSSSAANGSSPDDQAEDWYEGGGNPPDITALTSAERETMLRIAPFRDQVDYFNRDPAQTVQRWATAGIISLLASTKGPLLAAAAITSPAWWPWVQAAYKNNSLATQYPYIGLWRTQVLQVDVQGRRVPRFSENTGNVRAARSTQALQPYLQLLVGDDSGARTRLAVPYDSRHDEVRVGEPAELLVVASKSTFEDFKALKEAYLPESSLWLADYPYMDRDAFLDFSLQIERERSSSEQGAAAATPYL